ncbi:MAG TPA: exo-alpha-sialidase, partial [Clostridia bacterium]|nr:exo-alpha-sialidase [Clostridia bacterium]
AGPSGPVTWGDSATVAGGGWGRMVSLTNGQWLCVSTSFPSGTNSYLAISVSTDECRTWTRLSKVAEAERTLDNGELVALPNGEVLLTMRSLVAGVSYRLPVYRSTDHGRTWSYLSNIDTSEGLGSRGLWEPDFWVLDDGRLVVTYSNEKHDNYSQIISEKVSMDNGASWSGELWVVAQSGGGSLRPGMSQMARMANGKYILVYEVVGLGNADVYAKVSDNGVSWPAGLGKRVPCQHCGPFVCSMPDGRVFVTSCENQVSFSEDFGETWQLIDPPAWNLGYKWSWPAVYAIHTNEVGVMAVNSGVKLRFGSLAAPTRWPNSFLQNFNDGEDFGWARYGGNFGITQGHYFLHNTNTYGKAMIGDGFWTDGTLEAEVLVATPGNAGLMIRTTDPDYTGPDDAFGYYVGLDTDGSVMLGRMENSWTELTRRKMDVQLNTWYRLRIKASGSKFRIYVDDMNQPKIEWEDAAHLRGQIGVRAFGCNALFDNVTFSNAVPVRLSLRAADAQLQFSWPQSAWSMQICAAQGVEGPWLPLTNAGRLLGGLYHLSISMTTLPARFFKLQ